MWGNLRETGHVLICFQTSQNSWTITQTRNPQPCGRPTAGGAQAASWRWRRRGPSPGVLPPDRWQAVRQRPAKPGSLAASPGLGFGARRPAAALVKLETAHDFPSALSGLVWGSLVPWRPQNRTTRLWSSSVKPRRGPMGIPRASALALVCGAPGWGTRWGERARDPAWPPQEGSWCAPPGQTRSRHSIVT